MSSRFFSVVLHFCLFYNLVECNKYSKEKNYEYQKLLSLDKPFRIQKLNVVWEKAVKKVSPEKLKLLYTDLKYQDKEELNWKSEKAKGLDKNGLKETLVQGSFKAILEKYGLSEDFKHLQSTLASSAESDLIKEIHIKNVFKDKKLNKLWLKAEQLGFSESEMQALKEEFQHHQNKIDQYYEILNQLHKDSKDDSQDNAIENFIHAEENQKFWKMDNPHQVLKEKHAELKAGYDYLSTKIIPNMKNMEFEEPQVNSLWEMAKKSNYTSQELESLRAELHHFEHRIKKLKVLTAMESEKDHSNMVDEAIIKREKKLKEYNYKVEKIHNELTSRILQRHTEL